ncbi:hypothetical protein [Pelomonas sp. KK5]|uniref:DUF7668 domain-containing protein n=1 Tax=Pelomonas sp. KK5 TaxID=1855730 RepID=UPI00097C49F3|nr:hypothetical protein [Pelomonas sp. KK5]
MSHLPLTATDQELIEFVDGWVRLMEAEDYDAAFSYTSQSRHMRWTPRLLRDVIKAYNESLPTQRVTLEGLPTDITQRKDVHWYPSPRPVGDGYIWYDLNIDGFASDLTATFDILKASDGFLIVLDDIHVM